MGALFLAKAKWIEIYITSPVIHLLKIKTIKYNCIRFIYLYLAFKNVHGNMQAPLTYLLSEATKQPIQDSHAESRTTCNQFLKILWLTNHR